MQRDCFIHVGTHKTASTTLQRILSNNTSALNARGLHYPRCGRRPGSPDAHHNIASDISGDSRWQPSHGGVRELVQEVAKTDCGIIISSESLLPTICHQQKFHDFCRGIRQAGLRIKFVVVLRNQIDYAQSLYLEMLRWEAVLPFKEFCEQALRDGKVRAGRWELPFDYDACLTFLENVPDSEVFAVSYDHPVRGSPVDDIFALLGLDSAVFNSGQELRLNPRRPLIVSVEEFVRRYDAGRPINRVERKVLGKRLGPIETEMPRMSRKRQLMFIDRFEASNREICRRYNLPDFERMRPERVPAEDCRTLDDIFSHKLLDAASASPAEYIEYFRDALSRRLRRRGSFRSFAS